MPQAWTKSEERMYKEIRRSSEQRGASKERAEEIAARTVNKHRREKGKTPNKSTSGTGNPNQRLENRTKRELYNRARELDIAGRSSMSKDQLVKAVRKQQ